MLRRLARLCFRFLLALPTGICMSEAAAKASLRSLLAQRRSALDPAWRKQASLRLAEQASGLPAPRHGGVVAGYLPIGEEIDPWPLIGVLTGAQCPVAAPVVVGKGRPLEFRILREGEPLEAGVMGTRHPAAGAPVVEPDFLIVPLLGFDRQGYRLGYGGGFYDRTLARLRRQRAIVAAGVAFDEQEVDSLPRGAHDERLDWIVTPTRLLAMSDM